MAVTRKYFTVEEANRTLPLVRRIVEDIVSAHGALLERMAAERALDAATPDPAGRQQLEGEIAELTESVNDHINELHELGVLFKGFDGGLVDFYSMLDERPVFLCWKLGEDQVGWWHELEAGYAGRRRLPVHLLGQVPGES